MQFNYHYLAVQGVYFPDVSVEAVLSVNLWTPKALLCATCCATQSTVLLLLRFTATICLYPITFLRS